MRHQVYQATAELVAALMEENARLRAEVSRLLAVVDAITAEPLDPEQLEAELDAAEGEPLTEEQVNRIMAYVARQIAGGGDA